MRACYLAAVLALAPLVAHAVGDHPVGDHPAQEHAADAAPAPDPFDFADFTWINGNSRQKDFPLKTKYFTGEFISDVNYIYDFNHPSDHTLIGSSNSGRTQEFQVQQLGIGGDFNYDNVHARLMTQFGMYSSMTPTYDASVARGQWNIGQGYKYITEAYGGYHFDVLKGLNVDAGVFLSYMGLCSYYNYDNWVYQMSYVSSNTPWYFNGLRAQLFVTDRLKVELWLINGWESYGMFNHSPGAGSQVLWRPTGDWSFVSNEYVGEDTLGVPGRTRVHSDNSLQYKYLDAPKKLISKAAFSVTGDFGCETGAGVSCTGGSPDRPTQNFLAGMIYNRFWFTDEKMAVTLGGGYMTNPGRYLVMVPPINGATGAVNSPAFPQTPGTDFRAWDATATFNFMPSQFITFVLEYAHRHANVPYFAGEGGITPVGGNTGNPAVLPAGFTPDLRRTENRMNLAMLVRF